MKRLISNIKILYKIFKARNKDIIEDKVLLVTDSIIIIGEAITYYILIKMNLIELSNCIFPFILSIIGIKIINFQIY